MECGVCWWAYDPKDGAVEHDLLPGTAFTDLPESFRCPECDAPKDKFMLKPDVEQASHSGRNHFLTLEERLGRLKAAYEKAEDAVVSLPVHNAKLRVELTPFETHHEGYVGVVITPWCMNITLLHPEEDARPIGAIGSKREIAFPSGTYEFMSAHLEGFGALETCSLISPMDDFDDPEVARITADAALKGLMQFPDQAEVQNLETPKKEPEQLDRRAFLRGGRRTAVAS